MHFLTQNSTQSAFVSFSRVLHQKEAGLKTSHHSSDTTLADNRGNHSDGTRDSLRSVKLNYLMLFPYGVALLQDFTTPRFPHCWPWSRREKEFLTRLCKNKQETEVTAAANSWLQPEPQQQKPPRLHSSQWSQAGTKSIALHRTPIGVTPLIVMELELHQFHAGVPALVSQKSRWRDWCKQQQTNQPLYG